MRVARVSFNHGGTRQLAAEAASDAEILVYLTQDAILEGPEALEKLAAAFQDPQVGAAYGRQLPRRGAGPIEAHARRFNYPEISEVRTFESRKKLGIKAVFLSNSFAAYRRSSLFQVGGFPMDSVFGEDTIIAARLLMANYKIAYVSEARAFHSHSYSPLEEFRRYFDIGVLHSREHHLFKQFGQASGEGKRFVSSEFRYLLREDLYQIPSAIFRSALKLIGYRLGQIETHISPQVKRHLSLHPNFW